MTTTSTIPGFDDFNWVIGPACRCTQLVAESSATSTFLHMAIDAVAHQEPLLWLAREKLHSINKTDALAGIDKLIFHQGNIAQQAKYIQEASYHPVHVMGVIALWGAIEVAVEDTVLLILTKDASAVQTSLLLLDKPPAIAEGVLSEVDARRIADRLQRQFRKGKLVVEGYVTLLAALNITLTVTADAALSLSELNYVRNCLLHRGGVIDARVTDEAPTIGYAVGESLKIDSERYLHYFRAASEFSQALLNGVLLSSYVRYRSAETLT